MSAEDPGQGTARCPGETVQDVLGRDPHAPPAVLRLQSTMDLGDGDIPRERYLSREWHDLETQRLWRRIWQVACREEEIPQVGDHVVYEVAGSSLIVVRTAADRIQAFHNACLHRGTTLRHTGGRVPEFRCPFHGFTWALDGSLKSIPCQWDFPHIDRDDFGLPEAKVGTWAGWVLVNMDLDAMPLADFLGGFPGMFPWRQEDMYVQAHVIKTLPCNWKVALEAFLESYHVIATHPQLLSTLGDANTQYDVFPGEPRWNRMITVQGVQSPHLDGALTDQDIVDAMLSQFVSEGLSVPIPDGLTARQAMANILRPSIEAALPAGTPVSESEVIDAIQYYVFPNFVPWGGYSGLNYQFRPSGDDPGRCLMDVYMLAPVPPSGRPPAARPQLLGLEQSWSEATGLGPLAPVFDQDTANLPRIQRGLRAMTKPGVTLGAYQEIRIRHYHQELGRWLDRP